MKRDYYLFQGERIARKDNTIRLIYADKPFKDLPIEKVRAFYIMSELDMNSKFINFMNTNNVIMHFFNYYGYYTGSLMPKENYLSGEMLTKQVLASVDDQLKLIIAKTFLEGASYNIKRNLRYYEERGKNVDYTDVEVLSNRMPRCLSINELMGVEGLLRKNYYDQWDYILNNLSFGSRSKQPPENEINALLSFLNVMTYTVCLSEIYKTHLNPTVSFLHTSGTRRYSLALDISEVFKPLIVDRLLFTLINKQMIGKNDFVKGSNGVFLSEHGRKKVLEHFDKRLNVTIKHSTLNRNVSYRQLIRLELLKLEKLIMFGETYEPFKLSW